MVICLLFGGFEEGEVDCLVDTLVELEEMVFVHIYLIYFDVDSFNVFDGD